MRLTHIKGEYDAIFSLGSKCLAAIQLESNELRPCSGVLDWMISKSLTHVNVLLANRFAAFMEPTNMGFVNYENQNIYLFDHLYQIMLVHDLAIDDQGTHRVELFPEFKEKINRRIQRFLDCVDSGKRILFVRLGGTYEEAVQLQLTLSQLVKGPFTVLLINDYPFETLVENDWPLERVCAVQMPLELRCDALWTAMLSGIRLA
ncbi:DUF1796 family putative cysteine peptidase [Paenibacillus sp. 481]|uniref:DUF1796 family putative cysteine peptidase n=1 Tax=Paenibacillus sp. 481 TaxID=2835869 RepID=UPI001E41D454|nr:DUF1796 family putative cysteine peptidase [Paenibacillus sp. 481]UHA74021.1 peptidase [Paenibacillus sp. 481]